MARFLTSPTDTASTTSDSEGALSVTTDEANGTLYWVVTTSTTPPSAAQVKAGQDHTGAAATFSANDAIGSTGVKNKTATGLTGGTNYWAYMMHEDAAANQSNVADAGGFTTKTWTATTDNFTSSGTWTKPAQAIRHPDTSVVDDVKVSVIGGGGGGMAGRYQVSR